MDGGGGSSFRLVKAGGCDAMPRRTESKFRADPKAAVCQGMYAYSTRRLGLASTRCA